MGFARGLPLPPRFSLLSFPRNREFFSFCGIDDTFATTRLRSFSPFPRSRRHFSLFRGFLSRVEEVIKNHRKKKRDSDRFVTNSRILRLFDAYEYAFYFHEGKCLPSSPSFSKKSFLSERAFDSRLAFFFLLFDAKLPQFRTGISAP